MNVNYAVSPVRKAVLGLLAPLIYTSSVMATENSVESTPNTGVTPYIVNGSNASVTEFPSMASLFIDRIDYDGVYSTGPYCGATILDPTHILTAAHCIYGNEEGQLFTVVVPQIEDTSQFPNGNIQKARVSEVYYRSDYSNALSDLLRNDVAILKLESALNIDSVNDVVKRPSDESYRVGVNDFVAVGHGDTRSGFDGTTLLQKADLNYVDNATCASAFTDGSALTDNQICFIGDYRHSLGYMVVRVKAIQAAQCIGRMVLTTDKLVLPALDQILVVVAPTVTSVFTEIHDYEAWIDSVIAGTETAKFVSTDAKRTAYVNARTSTGSGSSGGSVSFGLLGMLMLFAGLRKAVLR